MTRTTRLLLIGLFVVFAGAAVFARWETVNGHAVPAPVSILVGAGVLAYCAIGLARFLRASAAEDRPPLTFTNGWLAFLAITASLLGVPVIALLADDPGGNAVVGAVMFGAGLVLVGLFVWYIRKPVLDHGEPVGDFYAGDRQRRRSPRVAYGRNWTVASDASGLYTVTWLRDTKEICALRSRRSPGPLRIDTTDPLIDSAFDGTGTVEVLGWAEDQATLDRALAGWQQHMDGPDSLSWLRARLAQAAAETPRRPT